MTASTLEHVNFTVADPRATAAWLCRVFDWKIRWQGAAKIGGFTVHVGGDNDYLALYAPPQQHAAGEDARIALGGMNHLGIVVADLDAAEARVKAEGFATHSHADYEPGRRFYFDDGNGIEFEVVSYEN